MARESSPSDRISALEAEALLRDAEIVELAREVDNLHGAMESRAPIEQAKGVIMSVMHCSSEAAFAVLVAASQRENVRLKKIATRIAAAQQQVDQPTDTGSG